MYRFVVFTGVLVVHLTWNEAAKLPASWGRCHKSDQTFPECLRENVEVAVRSLEYPTPELGLTAMDPLDIPELFIGAGQGPVDVAQHFKKVKLHGLTNVKVIRSSIDWDKKVLEADSLNPELILEADYSMKGRVLLLPIVGDGPCNVTLLNMKIHHHMTFDYVERKGKTYMKVVDFKVTMNPEKVVFKFDNLFNGQKELGDNINQILNDNNAEVFGDVRGGYEKSFGIIFKDVANRVLHKVPVKDIFLE